MKCYYFTEKHRQNDKNMLKNYLKGSKEERRKHRMENNEITNEIEKIKERNKKVELDKKWETCWTRKICICILTYIIVVIYSYIVKNFDNIFLSSLIPVIGFTLSTLSLKFARNIWEKTTSKSSLIKD